MASDKASTRKKRVQHLMINSSFFFPLQQPMIDENTSQTYPYANTPLTPKNFQTKSKKEGNKGLPAYYHYFFQFTGDAKSRIWRAVAYFNGPPATLFLMSRRNNTAHHHLETVWTLVNPYFARNGVGPKRMKNADMDFYWSESKLIVSDVRCFKYEKDIFK